MKRLWVNAQILSKDHELKDLIKGITGKASMWAVVEFASGSQKRFDELMEFIYQTENKRLSAVASWPLGKIGELKPELFSKHHLRIIHALKENDYHSAVLRNLIRN